jgi:signal transduction histidine kinase
MIHQGLLKPEELQRALDYQKERSNRGESILIGQALLELNLVTRETLDQVITVQILELQSALGEANRTLQQRVDERTLELQRALGRLAELNQLKSNFISNISHELRTPLTHIKGYLDILADGGLGSLNKLQQEAIDVIRRAEERLEQLIEDLIQFSMASRGELGVKPQAVDLEQLIRIVLHRLEQKVREKEITVSIDITDKLPPVNADDDKIGWVLMQLLDNAVKFTPRKGKVEVQAVVVDRLVRVAVMDTGIGIPNERLVEIFEPFHQLDGSITRRYSGTGLGLAMAQRIIEAHGSVIIVESAVDKGTRFEFNLPLATDEHATA